MKTFFHSPKLILKLCPLLPQRLHFPLQTLHLIGQKHRAGGQLHQDLLLVALVRLPHFPHLPLHLSYLRNHDPNLLLHSLLLSLGALHHSLLPAQLPFRLCPLVLLVLQVFLQGSQPAAQICHLIHQPCPLSSNHLLLLHCRLKVLGCLLQLHLHLYTILCYSLQLNRYSFQSLFHFLLCCALCLPHGLQISNSVGQLSNPCLLLTQRALQLVLR